MFAILQFSANMSSGFLIIRMIGYTVLCVHTPFECDRKLSADTDFKMKYVKCVQSTCEEKKVFGEATLCTEYVR